MINKKKICPTCAKEKYMFTRKYGCKECSAKNKKPKVKKMRQKIKPVSKKQAISNTAVKKAKAKVFNEMLEEYGYIFCTSCGIRSGAIDPSHVIPISDNKSLEAEYEIIFPQCRNVCHAATEIGSPKMKSFLNYDEIMFMIKKHDPDYYRKLKVKHEEKI